MAQTGPISLPAVVLCGGRGSRIGGDKAFRTLSGRPLLDHVLDRLSAQASPLAINAPPGDPRLEAYGLPLLPDRLRGYPGPLAGIAAALAWAKETGAAHVVVAPVDVPFLPEDFVARLSEDASAAIAVAQTGDRVHPVAGRFSVGLLADAEAVLAADERRSLMAWLDRHAARRIVFEPIAIDGRAVDPLFNVNTLEALAEAGRLLAASPDGNV